LNANLIRFVLRRSISIMVVLVVVISITAIALYSYNLQRCAGVKVEIRQAIENEIITKHITFPTNEARDLYIQGRMDSELKARGLDYCI